MSATDDLAPLLVSQPAQAVRFGQGIVLNFDSATHENLIDWNGIELEDLPLIDTGVDLGLGDVVALLGWDAGGKKGTASWWILGRLLIPGD